LLRIEDTDRARSEKKYEEDIVASLKWLGLNWDGEIYRQSERLEIYENYLRKLLDDDLAYWCFCSTEELEVEREAQLSQGFAPKYGGKCRNLPKKGTEEKLKNSAAVIRFKIPEKKVSWHDLTRGKIEFDLALMGDILIAKGLKEPLYNFAAAVDDFEMKITHVIRGEDHISNTPKQLALQEALGFHHPHYAHLPLILGADKKKLSKRFLENSVLDYEKNGYLPEAILNFLALLGWHPERDREILSVGEMMEEFSLKRVQKSGAVFNLDKLNWLNAHYIKNMPTETLFSRLKPFIQPFLMSDENFIKKVIDLEKSRLKQLNEFEQLTNFFFISPDYQKETLIWQKTPEKIIVENLKAVLIILEGLDEENFSKGAFENKITELADERGRGEVFWPLRVALSGQEASPGPLELIGVFGKKETGKRIKQAIQKLTGD